MVVHVSCGVSAASELLGKPGTYQPGSPESWDPRYPLSKTKTSADLVHYFSGAATFFVQIKNNSGGYAHACGRVTGRAHVLNL